jgi:hypothetical protein
MTGKEEEVVEHVFAVCDARTGVVYLMHSVVALDGAEPPGESDAEAEALAFAKETGDVLGRLKVVRVPPGSLKSGASYKLNVKLGTLEPIALQSVRKPRKRAAKKRRAR